MNPIVKLLLDGLIKYLQNNPAQVEALIAFLVGEIAKAPNNG